jgi:hypothetical protein
MTVALLTLIAVTMQPMSKGREQSTLLLYWSVNTAPGFEWPHIRPACDYNAYVQRLCFGSLSSGQQTAVRVVPRNFMCQGDIAGRIRIAS